MMGVRIHATADEIRSLARLAIESGWSPSRLAPILGVARCTLYRWQTSWIREADESARAEHDRRAMVDLIRDAG